MSEAHTLLQALSKVDPALKGTQARAVLQELGCSSHTELCERAVASGMDEIVQDVLGAVQRETEQSVWKHGHYRVIEWYRSKLRSSSQALRGSNRRRVQGKLDSLVEELCEFLIRGDAAYKRLLERLDTRYRMAGFRHALPDLLTAEANVQNGGASWALRREELQAAATVGQHALVCLGDMARYMQLHSGSKRKDFGQAEAHYQRAAWLLPSHGRAHNQLAVIASYRGHTLDSVYRHLRAMCATVPFATARSNLQAQFARAAQRARSTEFLQHALSLIQRDDLQVDAEGTVVRATEQGRRKRRRGGSARLHWTSNLFVYKEEDAEAISQVATTRFVHLLGLLHSHDDTKEPEDEESAVNEHQRVLHELLREYGFLLRCRHIDDTHAMRMLVCLLASMPHVAKSQDWESANLTTLLLMTGAAIFYSTFTNNKSKEEDTDEAAPAFLPAINTVLVWLLQRHDLVQGSVDAPVLESEAWQYLWRRLAALCTHIHARVSPPTDAPVQPLVQEVELRGLPMLDDWQTRLDYTLQGVHTDANDDKDDDDDDASLQQQQRFLWLVHALTQYAPLTIDTDGVCSYIAHSHDDTVSTPQPPDQESTSLCLDLVTTPSQPPQTAQESVSVVTTSSSTAMTIEPASSQVTQPQPQPQPQPREQPESPQQDPSALQQSQSPVPEVIQLRKKRTRRDFVRQAHPAAVWLQDRSLHCSPADHVEAMRLHTLCVLFHDDQIQHQPKVPWPSPDDWLSADVLQPRVFQRPRYESFHSNSSSSSSSTGNRDTLWRGQSMGWLAWE